MKLTHIRKNHGFTQQDIADAVGVDRSTVAKWENGSAEPRVETLRKLANVLKCTTDELLKTETTRDV